MTPSEPIVSVIVPTYNSSGLLRLTLATVVAQDFQDFEVWIVGDGCTDDSADVVASFDEPRFHWMNLPENWGGPSRPRHEAAREVRGRYIAYLGHDDLWFPWHLSSLVAVLEEGTASFACSLGALIGPDGCYAALSLPSTARGMRSAPLSPSNWMHRKSLLETIGSWRSDLKIGDDREFIERVWASGVPLSFSGRFSVLKFPSGLWRMYALGQAYPQTSYVEAMQHDPKALQDRLLIDLGVRFSQLPSSRRDDRHAVAYALRRLASRALHGYGCHRWPVSWFLYRRWRRAAGLN